MAKENQEATNQYDLEGLTAKDGSTPKGQPEAIKRMDAHQARRGKDQGPYRNPYTEAEQKRRHGSE